MNLPNPTNLTNRLIACLDVRDGLVVKGVNFQGLTTAGDPAELAARYEREGVDELVMLDVSATLESRRARQDTINRIARELSVPLTVGGGIRSMDDASAAFGAGADKVALNSAALDTPDLITAIAQRYGSQAVVVAIDAKRVGPQLDAKGSIVFTRSGTGETARTVIDWAHEAERRGAGEILLTSIDRDGTKQGFDCELTAWISTALNIPVIASGGAGTREHFVDVFTAGRADAALAASIFHYAEHSIPDLKQFLAARGIAMRIDMTTPHTTEEDTHADTSN